MKATRKHWALEATLFQDLLVKATDKKKSIKIIMNAISGIYNENIYKEKV